MFSVLMPILDLVQANYVAIQSSVECIKQWPSMAIIVKSDLLHGTVHYSTKFQANILNP